MATVTGPSKQHAKYDDFVEAQLEKARKRIRTLDVMTALLGFAAGTLAYAVVMALLDNAFTLPPAALYTGFFLYLAGALTYLGLTVVRPLTAHINPYFAARQVEQTLPGAKNSVVNWLDLHADDRLPTAIHGAVSQKAARDLAKADLERAVSGRRAGWMGGVVAGLGVVLLMLLFALGARKLFSHLGRAFLPFSGQAVAKHTDIVLLEPEGGNATIAADQPFTVRAVVNGRVPETLKLISRRTRTDPEQEYALDLDKAAPGEWVVTIPANEVKNGFFYRVIGGDATTEEYRLDVRSTPAILAERFTATYRYRKYVGQPVERVVRKERTLRDLRGTTVTLDVPTNRKLKSGEVVLLSEGQKQQQTIRARIVAGNEKALSVQFALERSGSYVIRFTSVEGESYVDAPPFPVEVREDTPPQVALTEPGKDETLAADALLKLKGGASDDIGVKELTLRLKKEGVALKSKPYRSPGALKMADGGYPNHVEYQDFLDLAQVKDEAGNPVELKPGMVLEYWLEARDACDYPEPKAGNVAESKHFKVTIGEPQRDEKKKEQQQQQARKEQQEHEKKQDQEKKKQEQNRQEQNEKQKQANQEARDQAQEKQGGKPGDKPKPKQDGEGGQDNRTDAEKQKDEQNRQKQQKLKDAAEKAEKERREQEEKAEQERRDRAKSKAKGEGEKDKRATGKDDPDTQQKDNQPDQKEANGKGKDNAGGKPGEGADNKAKPQPEKDAAHDQSTAKGKGKPEQGNKEQAGSKDNAGMKEGEQPAQGKDDPKQQPQKGDSRAQGKGGPDQKQDGKSANKGKPEGSSKPSEAKGKDGGKPDSSGQPKADKKDAGGKEGDKQATAKDGKEQGADQKQQAKSDGRGEAKGKESQQQDKPGQDTAKGAGQSKPEQAKGAGKDGGKQGKEEKASTKDGQGQKGEKRADAKDGTRQGDKQQGDKQQPERGAAKGQGQGDKQQAAQEKAAQGQGEKSKGKDNGKQQVADGKQGAAKGEPRQQAKGQCKDCKGGQSAGGAKPSAKDNTQAKSETKPTGGEAGSGTATAKDDRIKGDPHGRGVMNKPADKVTRDDVEKLGKDLESDNPKVRRDAENKLKEVSSEGKDERVRQEAEEKLGEARGGKPAATVKKSPSEGEKAGEPKEGNKGQKTAQAKGLGEAKGQGQGKKGEKGEQTTNLGQGKYTGARGRQQDATPENPREDPDDGRFSKAAGDLQLDKFSEKVRKDILKEANLTEEEYKQLLSDLKKRPLPPPAADPMKKPVVRGGQALPTTGAKPVGPVDDKKGVGSSDDGLPPLEYRDLYKKFTKALIPK